MTQTEILAKQEIRCIHEDDLCQHIEDELEVAAIRNGILVTRFWNELTAEEQRAAYCNLFSIY